MMSIEYGHAATVQVHFDDLDAMGIVHNSRYAVLLERALTGFWAERGHSFADGRGTTTDVFSAVREFAITYRRPINHTGDVVVHFWLDRLGDTSAVYGFRFVSPDRRTVFAQGRRVVVKLDPVAMRPAAWSEAARAVAEGLLAPARVG
jgi:acyl-CoA thioester hydrolase